MASALAIFAGIALVIAFVPPRQSGLPAPPTWLTVLVALAPIAAFPQVARRLGWPTGPILLVVAAGAADALSLLFATAVRDLLLLELYAAAGAAGVGVVGFAMLGFVNELAALRSGRASHVTPVIRSLQAGVPVVALAPVMFEETWPATELPKVLLAAGIALGPIGIVLLGSRSARLLPETVPAAAMKTREVGHA